MDTLDLLLHPVRLRIVHALSGAHAMTTADLCERLPDVPRTTVYRHVGLLVDAGVLEVVDERRVRGAVERSFRLRRERAVVDADAAASMSLDEHERGFAAAMAALHAEFNAYLGRPDADPSTDLVGYRQGTVWLRPDELVELVEDLRAVFAGRGVHEAAPGRRPYLVSTILFPTGSPESSVE